MIKKKIKKPIQLIYELLTITLLLLKLKQYDWCNTLIWIYNKRNNNKRETICIYKIFQNILNKTSRNVWMHCW